MHSRISLRQIQRYCLHPNAEFESKSFIFTPYLSFESERLGILQLKLRTGIKLQSAALVEQIAG